MATKSKSTEKNGEAVPSENIPEVTRFLDVQDQLLAFKVDNQALFREFDSLVDQYNAALEAAEKAVRLKEISCGPFVNYSTTPKIDAEKMFEELGEDLFFQCGGTTSKKTVYAVDKNRVAAAIASGKVPEECVPEFRTLQRLYHAPKKINL